MKQDKKQSRLRRARRGRAIIRDRAGHRLTVFRSPRHIYAQVITPDGSAVLASASTLESEIKSSLQGYTGNASAAAVVGRKIAERAKAAGLTKVSFDRAGFKFHGRIKALAEAARENGLDF